MAEDEDQQDDELSTSEAQELEKLLEETEGEEAEEGEKKEEKKEGPFLKKLLHRLKTDKKFLMIVGGGALLLIIGSGTGLYWFLSKEAAPPVAEEELAEPEKPEKVVEKAHVYTLEPFFLPLKIDERETGQFIIVTANLLLSNSALNEEVDKILPQIRKNIYNILRRKSPQDWFQDRVQIQERIKKEIITVANTDLLSGTGTIEDVFYTQFIVK